MGGSIPLPIPIPIPNHSDCEGIPTDPSAHS
jgi:hypothetical protein